MVQLLHLLHILQKQQTSGTKQHAIGTNQHANGTNCILVMNVQAETAQAFKVSQNPRYLESYL